MKHDGIRIHLLFVYTRFLCQIKDIYITIIIYIYTTIIHTYYIFLSGKATLTKIDKTTFLSDKISNKFRFWVVNMHSLVFDGINKNGMSYTTKNVKETH